MKMKTIDSLRAAALSIQVLIGHFNDSEELDRDINMRTDKKAINN